MLDFERCVTAIAEVVAHAEADAPDAHHEVAAYLLATHRRMPDHLRLGLRAATLIFDATSLATAGKPFHRLDLRRRSRQVERWGLSRIGPQRSLVAFYRTLGTYAAYAIGYEGREGAGAT